MSENIFHINPIFFLPIDAEDNKKMYSESENKSHTFISSENKLEKCKMKISKDSDINIEEETTNGYTSSSSGKEKSENSSNMNHKKEDNYKMKDKEEVIIFSKCKNDRYIKSLTNSNKIYTSEIFKKNWKLKCRRLITKLKMKLIKQYKNSFKEKLNYDNYKNLSCKNILSNSKNNIFNSLHCNNFINHNNYENNYVNKNEIGNNISN